MHILSMEKCILFNHQHDRTLKLTRESTGVRACSVGLDPASAMAEFLVAKWSEGRLKLSNGRLIQGYKGYWKTLKTYDNQQQLLNTLRIDQTLLPHARRLIPGFAEMELAAIELIRGWHGVEVESPLAHVLRQEPDTQSSTGFDIHQDTEEFDFIE